MPFPSFSSSPEPAALVGAMLSHRDRVLRQVSGSPRGPLGALVQKVMETVSGPQIAWGWQKGDAGTLSKVDQALVGILLRQGLISQPHVVEPQDQNEVPLGPHAVPNYGGPGTVAMVSNRMGDFEASPQMFSDPKDLAREWASHDGVERIYQRWFILLHEIAHCEFASIDQPFRPTPGRCSEDFIQAMNHWVGGPLSLAPASTKALLSEGHSDAFAAMALLRLTKSDPRALAVVKKMLGTRVYTERTVAAKVARNLQAGGHMRGDFVDEHCTGAALHKVLQEKERWEDAPPETVRSLALQYASDGLMTRLHAPHPLGCFADRLDPSLRSVPVGRVLSETLITSHLDPARLSPTLFWLWFVRSSGGDPQGWVAAQDQTHPLSPLLADAFRATLSSPRIRQVQELYDSIDEGPASGFAAAIRRESRWVGQEVGAEIERVLKTLCNPQNPDWRRAQAAHHQGMDTLSQAFGLARGPRSLRVVANDVRLEGDPSPSRRQAFAP